MNHIRSFATLACAAALLAALASVPFVAAGAQQAAPPAQKPTADAALAILEPYIGGEWKAASKWSDGRPLNAREVFTWGIGKKFINVKTFVTPDNGPEYQRYEAMYGTKDGKLTSWNFTYDGSTDTAEWTVDGKKLSTATKQPAADGSEQTLHQSIELVEPHKFHWVVAIEKNGLTQTIFDGHWVRDPADTTAVAK